ncbi:MAG: hypothetical protein AAF939_13230 [Planctomycetota bacterium]
MSDKFQCIDSGYVSKHQLAEGLLVFRSIVETKVALWGAWGDAPYFANSWTGSGKNAGVYVSSAVELENQG